jgi:L-alanine-DL-glutamate epimerase-like enolase superfamily enzyme
MDKSTDVRVAGVTLYFLPVTLRMPLKFGSMVTREITYARAKVAVVDRAGKSAVGWGETPLAAQWGWPSALAYDVRHQAMQDCCVALAQAWTNYQPFGHPLELGHDFARDQLPGVTEQVSQGLAEPVPHLAALICLSLFDIALHDAYGNLQGVDVYQTYGPKYLNRDLAAYLEPLDPLVNFAGKYPADFLVADAPKAMPAWHLVGGLDPLVDADRTGDEPNDGHPVTLDQWIKQDGLTCLKIKLRGDDAPWDYDRTVRVGRMAIERNVQHLSTDFNCTVREPSYVNQILDDLASNEPEIYRRLLYVEQPFPYDLQANPIVVHEVSRRKPLFLDESAHDWRYVRHGRELGWSGVALKTCKTQTGALLSLCWAKAHGMPLMVQDLTNAMLAQIPHVRLAAHAGTIMGVETNGMQFYPEASLPEAAVHPGLYQRRNGQVDLSTLTGSGFGYKLENMQRELPPPAWSGE